MRSTPTNMLQKLDVSRLETSKVVPWVCLLLWFVLIVPAISLRGFHYEEGTVVALARGALEDGHWIVPHHYGMRFVERPALMSWLIAVLGSVFGINQWTVRLPHVASLLVGGILVFRLARTQVSALAASFAASCFLLSPIILQKRTTAEPDVMLSVMLFGAFMVWWEGHVRGGPTLWRWLATGLLLAAATLIKGPQPAAYFLLGVGAFLVLRRHWDELPGFILANAIAAAVALGWYAAIYQPHGFKRMGGPFPIDH